jgi:hypothetical protein
VREKDDDKTRGIEYSKTIGSRGLADYLHETFDWSEIIDSDLLEEDEITTLHTKSAEWADAELKPEYIVKSKSCSYEHTASGPYDVRRIAGYGTVPEDAEYLNGLPVDFPIESGWILKEGNEWGYQKFPGGTIEPQNDPDAADKIEELKNWAGGECIPSND